MPENVSKFLCNLPNIKVKEEIADEELQAGLDVLEKMNEKVFNEESNSECYDFKVKIQPKQEIDTNENDKTSDQKKLINDMGIVEYYHSLTEKTFANRG